MERERLEYDVLIIGGGPAGLACALALAEEGRTAGKMPAICLLEKAAEIGLHTVSGAIIDPYPLDALAPGWREDASFPIRTEVAREELWLLTRRGNFTLPQRPLPPMLKHSGQLVGPLSELVRWLAGKAEAAGVDIFPGFAAQRAIFDEKTGALMGVIAGEAGLEADGSPGPNYEPGVEITARFVVLAEGAKGNIGREVISRFGLFKYPVHYALGIKELWRLEEEKPELAGNIIHTLGLPLFGEAAGGGFLYYQDARHISVGLVTHMDWRNPWLSPYRAFQDFKLTALIAPLLRQAERIGYGARSIAMASPDDVEALAFPGGLFVGDAFGVVNPARAQGVHAALESGLVAGRLLAEALARSAAHTRLAAYPERIRRTRFWRELELARNIKPLWRRFGLLGAFMGGGIDLWAGRLLGRRLLPAMRDDVPDHARLIPAERATRMEHGREEGESARKITFCRSESLALAGVSHRPGQPVHLKVLDMDKAVALNWRTYAGPEQRYCPAGVYQWRIEKESGTDAEERPVLRIQAENCLHCKACEIKDPGQNIIWTPPEGGDGPHYRGL